MAETRKKKLSPWKVATVLLTVLAVIKELLTPKEERTWQGKLAGFIPYDFRMPTWQRIRDTYWDPEGPLLPGQVFGVGWTLNLGAVKNGVGG